jgi:hypothetical protein
LQLCKFFWGERTEARMWPGLIIVQPPAFDDLSRFGQASEQMLVQALVAQAAVEAYMDPARAQGCKSADENPVAVIYPAFNRSGVVRSEP